jgi:hypothetical protein
VVAVEIVTERLEHVEADALVVPVDGQLCRLGGAAASALRVALRSDATSAEICADELEYVEDQLARLRPLPHPQARTIDGVARWKQLIVVAAYPHDVDGATFSPGACARMVRAAVPSAIAQAAEPSSLAIALIGTQYRMPIEIAVRAFVDGLAAASGRVLVRWSVPDAEIRALAESALHRLGLA